MELISGHDLNALGADSGTALSYAVKDHECIQMLIETGASVNVPDSFGNTPLLM